MLNIVNRPLDETLLRQTVSLPVLMAVFIGGNTQEYLALAKHTTPGNPASRTPFNFVFFLRQEQSGAREEHSEPNTSGGDDQS